MEKLWEEMSREILEEEAAHMKTELISHISPITLKIQSVMQSQTIQVKSITEDPVRKKFLANKKRRTTRSVISG